MSIPDSRELALHVLQQRERGKGYTEDLLAAEFHETKLSPEDRGLAQELTYGVVRWQGTLDWLIQRKTPPGRSQKVSLQLLLQLGLYQLFWLQRIPDHAAVHETVALAKRLGFGPQAGFVNAILRGYLRERVQTEALLKDLKTRDPALGYSHPAWLFARWEQRWGRDSAIRLLQLNNAPPRTFARVNTLRPGADSLLQSWDREQVRVHAVALDWVAPNLVFELLDHPPLKQLGSFEQGLFYVQDPSTLLAVHELDPKPGERILDVCAAPGGKTTYIAQQLGNKGEVAAADLDPGRLRLVAENCARLGADCVRILTDSARETLYDRVLVDAPCSNTGVMGRRVDLRWRIRPEEIQRLQATQRALLGSAAQQVRPGGTLIYSTCSLEREENQEVVAGFLEDSPGFLLVRERELLPFREGFDGAYVATLKRGER